MIRIATIFLCMLLAAAAAGRYRAEVSVKETRAELKRLEISKTQELQSIQMLRAEVAYLENPNRLSKIAEAKTDLRPSVQDQMLNARQFATKMDGSAEGELPYQDRAPIDAISNAIAMAQLTDAQ